MMEQTRISLTEFWEMINEIKGRITALEQQRNFNPDEIWTAKEVATYARVF